MSSQLSMKLALTLGLNLGLAACSCAHFVWATLDRTTRSVNLRMEERPGADTLDYAGRLKPLTHLLTKGSKESTTSADTITYGVEESSNVALARIDYGTFDRGSGVWNLVYYAKAVLTASDAEIAVGKGLEIVAVLRGNQWEVKALLNGKAAPKATIVLDDEEAANEAELGKARTIPISTDKPIALRATISEAKPGNLNGKAYVGTKVWSTVLLPATPEVTKGSGAIADRAVQRATEARESLSYGSKPWTMSYSATNGSTQIEGNVTWNGATFEVIGDTASPYWKHVKSEISSLLFHRLASDFARGEGKTVITSTADSRGTLYHIADAMDSSYRIANGSFTEVARTVGGKRLVLTINQVVHVPGNRELSAEYRSLITDPTTKRELGALQYRDTFQRFGSEWVPASRKVDGKEGGKTIHMQVVFSKPKEVS